MYSGVIYTWYQLLVQCTRVNKCKKSSSTPYKCLASGTDFFCAFALLSSYFLLPYPGMFTVSCSCSFVCAVPGAAICQLSGRGVYYKYVRCKLQTTTSANIYTCICIYIIYTYIYAPRCQVQRVRTSIHLHIYIPDLVPGAAIYQLSGGGVLPTARIYSVIYTWYQLLVQCTRVNKYKKSSPTPNKCLVPGTAFFVPYFLLFSYFLLPCPGMVTVSCSCPFVCAVPGAAICQLSGGGCTINISSANCKQQVQKNKKNGNNQERVYPVVK